MAGTWGSAKGSGGTPQQPSYPAGPWDAPPNRASVFFAPLLRQDDIARHLPQGSEDPGNIIPFALDGSFTAEGIPRRVNLVLLVDTAPFMAA